MSERLRQRVRYLWRDANPEGVEILSACVSFWYFFVLSPFNWQTVNPTYQPLRAMAFVCLTASLCRFVGVLTEWRALRLLGLSLGVIFWTVLTGFLGFTVAGGITWGGFAIVAVAQLWAFGRVSRP